VRTDVLDGKVSREHARSAYGVVIDDNGVNAAATQALRTALRAASPSASAGANTGAAAGT
jgi:hypothetical protein